MRKISFNIDASEQDFAETVDALDAVLFSACMYYLDVKDRDHDRDWQRNPVQETSSG